jgi:hypothetical protein
MIIKVHLAVESFHASWLDFAISNQPIKLDRIPDSGGKNYDIPASFTWTRIASISKAQYEAETSFLEREYRIESEVKMPDNINISQAAKYTLWRCKVTGRWILYCFRDEDYEQINAANSTEAG